MWVILSAEKIILPEEIWELAKETKIRESNKGEQVSIYTTCKWWENSTKKENNSRVHRSAEIKSATHHSVNLCSF